MEACWNCWRPARWRAFRTWARRASRVPPAKRLRAAARALRSGQGAQRSPGMTYEILLSESQERMLIIVTKGREEEVKRIFDK